jgi:hypothetical protein
MRRRWRRRTLAASSFASALIAPGGARMQREDTRVTAVRLA